MFTSFFFFSISDMENDRRGKPSGIENLPVTKKDKKEIRKGFDKAIYRRIIFTWSARWFLNGLKGSRDCTHFHNTQNSWVVLWPAEMWSLCKSAGYECAQASFTRWSTYRAAIVKQCGLAYSPLCSHCKWINGKVWEDAALHALTSA